MIECFLKRWRHFAAALCFIALTTQADADQPTHIFSVSNQVVSAGSTAIVRFHALNSTSKNISWVAPKEISARLRNNGQTVSVTLEATPEHSAERFSITPGSFASRDYLFIVPEAFSGEAILKLTKFAPNQLVLDIRPAPTKEEYKETEGRLARWLRDAEPDGTAKAFDPMRFFQQHISGYEPFYFIAGTASPNAKFQISFKYQLVNQHGLLAKRLPNLERIHLAYTQTSLWDWDAPSSPFFDSSYKPEVLYAWDKLAGGGHADSFRLDFQLGLQHESNGGGGLNSRSLNIAYIRPTLVLGGDKSLQLTLQPRAWVYVGDLNDNPDLADYRGYGDLRAIVGWKRGLQVATTGRLGDSWDNGALQIDLTYPMMRFFYSNFSFYLHAQYFTGYGESLVRYDEKSSAFRLGFSMYR
ncbi:MAG: phospholipase A [Verrucomicrobia bacterium]|jgi:outer membrane phospholipase A|nr:phospholipase A [Verrucomicrobiota bacterium]